MKVKTRIGILIISLIAIMSFELVSLAKEACIEVGLTGHHNYYLDGGTTYQEYEPWDDDGTYWYVPCLATEWKKCVCGEKIVSKQYYTKRKFLIDPN